MFLYSLMRFYIGINGVLSRDALTDNYTAFYVYLQMFRHKKRIFFVLLSICSSVA